MSLGRAALCPLLYRVFRSRRELLWVVFFSWGVYDKVRTQPSWLVSYRWRSREKADRFLLYSSFAIFPVATRSPPLFSLPACFWADRCIDELMHTRQAGFARHCHFPPLRAPLLVPWQSIGTLILACRSCTQTAQTYERVARCVVVVRVRRSCARWCASSIAPSGACTTGSRRRAPSRIGCTAPPSVLSSSDR